MDIEKLEDEIKMARLRIDCDKETIRKVQLIIAEYSCPFSVGDKIINSHGDKAFVASVNYCSYGSRYDFKIFKEKKNGEPYKDSSMVWLSDDWKAVE